MDYKHQIHKSPEEKLADAVERIEENVSDDSSSKDIIEKIHELKETIEKNTEKGDHIKSASLVTNRLLKKIATKISEEVKPMELWRTIKGDKGNKGERGEQGERGEKGSRGEKGEKGERGEIGLSGKDGLHGSLITVEQIAEKINSKKRHIDFKVLKNIPDELNEAVERIRHPVGKHFDVAGGANKLVIQNQGTRLSDSHTTLNFSTGLTATYSNGVISIVSSGAGSQLAATGAVNGLNASFTFTQQPSYIISDHAAYNKTNASGTINWTWTAATLTAIMTVPPIEDIFGIA